MKPVVDGLQAQYGGTIDFVIYANVNADEDVGAYAFEQRVFAAPTMMLAGPDGIELARWEGEVPAADISAALGAAP